MQRCRSYCTFRFAVISNMTRMLWEFDRMRAIRSQFSIGRRVFLREQNVSTLINNNSLYQTRISFADSIPIPNREGMSSISALNSPSCQQLDANFF